MKMRNIVIDPVHGTCTAREWTKLVDEVCRCLRDCGIRTGDRVVLALPSDVRAAVLIVALRRLHAVCVPISFGAGPNIIGRAVAATEARFAVRGVTIRSGCRLEISHAQEQCRVRPSPDNLAAIIFTSGSSGLPKGVMLSWEALSYQAQATATALGYSSDDTLYLPIPLWHSYGLSVFLAGQYANAPVVLDSYRSPRRLVQHLQEYCCSSCEGVPVIYRTLLRYLAQQPALAQSLGAQVRLWGIGGAPTPSTISDEFLARVGKPLLDGYGLTEAGPNVALSTPMCWRPGWVGRPLPGTEVRLSDTVSGQPSELMVRSPSVMLGYWAAPEATADALTDGWLRTGDLAELDSEGYLRIIGRLGRQIISAGCNVSPEEVEATLLNVEQIEEAAVLGLPDPGRGEAVTAFITTRCTDTHRLKHIIHRRLRLTLEHYKLPRRIVVVQEMPRTPSGKIDYQLLSDRAARHYTVEAEE